MLCRVLLCTSGSTFWHFKQASVISQVAQMPASCKLQAASPLEHSQRHFKHSQATTTSCPSKFTKEKANMPVTCLTASCLLFPSFLSFSLLCHFHSEMDYMHCAKNVQVDQGAARDWTRPMPRSLGRRNKHQGVKLELPFQKRVRTKLFPLRRERAWGPHVSCPDKRLWMCGLMGFELECPKRVNHVPQINY